MSSTSIDSFAVLSTSSLAAGMNEDQIRVLAGCGNEESFADGEDLVTWDDSASDLLLVVSGLCEIRTSMNDVLYKLGSGSLIGELSFLDHKPRSAHAVAVGECGTIHFPGTLLDDLSESRPDIVIKLLKNIGVVLCQKLRSTTRFVEAGFV